MEPEPGRAGAGLALCSGERDPYILPSAASTAVSMPCALQASGDVRRGSSPSGEGCLFGIQPKALGLLSEAFQGLGILA